MYVNIIAPETILPSSIFNKDEFNELDLQSQINLIRSVVLNITNECCDLINFVEEIKCDIDNIDVCTEEFKKSINKKLDSHIKSVHTHLIIGQK